MKSRNSITGGESRIVDIRGSGPALVSKEDKEGEKAPALAPTPAATVAVTPENDPFMVQLDQNDPSHARVRVSLCG